MLLTLTARSLSHRPMGRSGKPLRLDELPEFVLQQTELRGLVLDTELLKGWSMDRLEKLRITADQAGCPCLLLRESIDVDSGARNPDKVDKVIKRVELVAQAASRLGCNSMSLRPMPIKSTADIDIHAEFYRRLMERLDRLDLHLLLEPSKGALVDPHALISLVKKIGGFRIGTLPTYEIARMSDNPVASMRITAPYAGTVVANWTDEDAQQMLEAVHSAALAEAAAASDEGESDEDEESRAAGPFVSQCLAALARIGYDQILAIDYLGKSKEPIETINSIRDFILERVDNA